LRAATRTGPNTELCAVADGIAVGECWLADLASQVTLLEERVKELTQAVVLLSGPKGVTLASGEHMQLAAARSLEMNAGNNADIGVMKNLFIGVGQALSVFVRKAGIKLFANKGAISVQAQNDLMELLAKKSIEITSTEDEITITAKKKITINGGGSYIRLDPCGIEAGTQGEYNVKAGYYGRKPGAKITPEMMVFPVIESGEYCIRFFFSNKDGSPCSNTKYIATLDDGSKLNGVTGAEGYTEFFMKDDAEKVNVELLLSC
jgi:type VI secretion system secreted protein VgrG